MTKNKTKKETASPQLSEIKKTVAKNAKHPQRARNRSKRSVTRSLTTPEIKKQRAIEVLIKHYAFELPKGWGKPTKKGGRPSAITPDVLRKLEYAFAYDCTNEEACILAGIYPVTFYAFLKKQPEFANTITLLRHIPVLLARQSIVDSVITDPEKALKYLERKNKIEFSPKIELSHGGDVKHTHELDPATKETVDTVFGLFERKARETAETVVVIDDEG